MNNILKIFYFLPIFSGVCKCEFWRNKFHLDEIILKSVRGETYHHIHDSETSNLHENANKTSSKYINFISNNVEFNNTDADEETEIIIKNLRIVEATAESLTISWNVKSENASFSSSYLIEWFENNILIGNKSDIYAKLSYTIKNLKSCTGYMITVTPFMGVGQNIYGETSSIQNKPPKLINEGHTGNPPFESTKTTIMLNWDVRDSRNNCPIKSIVTQCTYWYTIGYGYKLVYFAESINNNTNGENLEIVNQTLYNLSPYTWYKCKAFVNNIAGTSESSIPISILTKEDAPSAPEIIDIVDYKNSTFTIIWKVPELMPGRLRNYDVVINWIEALYSTPDLPIKCPRQKYFRYTTDACNYTWHDAEGFTHYKIFVVANLYGGSSNRSEYKSIYNYAEGVSDYVTNLTYINKPQEKDPNSLETILSWNLPCSLRGNLKYFQIFVNGAKEFVGNHTFNATVPVNFNFTNNHTFSINLGELKPDFFYKFSISAVVGNSYKKGEYATYETRYPAGIPPQPSEDYMKSLISLNNITLTSTSFEILLPLFSDLHGPIKYYAVIVSQMNYTVDKSSMRCNINSNECPNLPTWKESMDKNFTIPYQASEAFWSPGPNHIVNYGSIKAVKFLIGEDATCNSMSTKIRLYCNGPLKLNASYEVKMRAFTEGGYADSIGFIIKPDTDEDKNVDNDTYVGTETSITTPAMLGYFVFSAIIKFILLIIWCRRVWYKCRGNNLNNSAMVNGQLSIHVHNHETTLTNVKESDIIENVLSKNKRLRNIDSQYIARRYKSRP